MWVLYVLHTNSQYVCYTYVMCVARSLRPGGCGADKRRKSAHNNHAARSRAPALCPVAGPCRFAGSWLRCGNLWVGPRRSGRIRNTNDRARRRWRARPAASGRGHGLSCPRPADLLRMPDRLPHWQAAARCTGPPLRTMADHFADLFGAYRSALNQNRRGTGVALGATTTILSAAVRRQI